MLTNIVKKHVDVGTDVRIVNIVDDERRFLAHLAHAKLNVA